MTRRSLTHGEKNLEFFNDGSRLRFLMGRLLISADKLTQAGNDFSLKTSCPHIKHPSGEVTPLTRRGGVFIMNMWLKWPPSEEGFTRQGA